LQIDITQGMSVFISTTSTPITSLSFINIPNFPVGKYVFDFTLIPASASSPYYLSPATNFIKVVTDNSGSFSVPLYGVSNFVLPNSYTYIIQTISIINQSTTGTPNFIALTSVRGI
jgi:hypothetical protein